MNVPPTLHAVTVIENDFKVPALVDRGRSKHLTSSDLSPAVCAVVCRYPVEAAYLAAIRDFVEALVTQHGAPPPCGMSVIDSGWRRGRGRFQESHRF